MKKILFVDDDPIAHDLMTGILKDWNFVSAHSGEEALKILEQEYGFIVITDIHMPGMTGIELIHKIREKFPIVQTIVLSSTEDTNNILAAYEAGANDFILKPFDKEKILNTVNNTMEKIKRWENAMGEACMKKDKVW